jgi:hypothetical protein
MNSWPQLRFAVAGLLADGAGARGEGFRAPDLCCCALSSTWLIVMTPPMRPSLYTGGEIRIRFAFTFDADLPLRSSWPR